jgi:hypothetical protein
MSCVFPCNIGNFEHKTLLKFNNNLDFWVFGELPIEWKVGDFVKLEYESLFNKNIIRKIYNCNHNQTYNIMI